MAELNQSKRVYVCHGLTCVQQARPVWNALVSGVQAQGLADTCELIVSGCQGRCEHGPNINVYPQLTKYAHMTPDKVRRVVTEHLAGGEPVREYVYKESYEL